MFLERNWYVRSAKTILLLVPIKIMGAHYIILYAPYWHNFNKATYKEFCCIESAFLYLNYILDQFVRYIKLHSVYTQTEFKQNGALL